MEDFEIEKIKYIDDHFDKENKTGVINITIKNNRAIIIYKFINEEAVQIHVKVNSQLAKEFDNVNVDENMMEDLNHIVMCIIKKYNSTLNNIINSITYN